MYKPSLRQISSLVAFLLIASSCAAYAYIDPGAGALLWQIVLATMVGALFYVRKIIGWVKCMFKGKKNAK